MKLSPFLLASVLSASVAWGAIDFFGLPEKIVVPKSVTPTPPPAPPPRNTQPKEFSKDPWAPVEGEGFNFFSR